MAVPLLLIAAAAAAAKGIAGGIQASKAKKEAARLAANRPVLPNNQYAQDQQALTASELARGNNTPGMQAYDEGIDRDLSSSIGALLKGGGDVNNISDLFSNSNQGRQRALLMGDNLRLNQINNYIRSSQYADNANQQRFQFNDWAPWADKAQANAQARIAANNKVWSAVDEFGSAAMQYGSGVNGGGGGGSTTPNLSSSTVNHYLPTPDVAGNYNTINSGAMTDVGQNSIYKNFNTINPNAPNWNLNP